KPSDFEFAERCLEQLAKILRQELHRDCASEEGTGAAGGLGFGLRCFAGGQIQSGFALFARQAKLDERIHAADLVVTGEGSLDASSVMGKGVGALADRCRHFNVPCIALAGVIPNPDQVASLFAQAYALTPTFTSAENAITNPAYWLEELTHKVAAELPNT